MHWFKFAGIAVGIFLAFLVGGWIIGFVIHAVLDLVIAAAVVGAIVVAVKMARSRQAGHAQAGGKARSASPTTTSTARPLPRADIEPVTPAFNGKAERAPNVDDELARLKREMGRWLSLRGQEAGARRVRVPRALAPVSRCTAACRPVEPDPRREPVRPIAHMVSSAGLPMTVTTGVAFFAVSGRPGRPLPNQYPYHFFIGPVRPRPGPGGA